MGLVDHDQPGALGQLGQHVVAEVGVVEPFGADQQHVDQALGHPPVDLLPLLGVGGVDGHGPDAGALGGGDLVAHQRQQRGDDDRGALAELPEQRGGDEVDGRLAPPRALDDQDPAALDHQGLDRRPLVVTQPRVLPRERAEVGLGFFPHHRDCFSHVLLVTRSRRRIRPRAPLSGRPGALRQVRQAPLSPPWARGRRPSFTPLQRDSGGPPSRRPAPSPGHVARLRGVRVLGEGVDGDPVHAAAFGVVGDGVVLGGAVVPEGERARPPVQPHLVLG